MTTRTDWLTECIDEATWAIEQAEARQDWAMAGHWRGRRGAYLDVQEAAPQWEPEPCGHEEPKPDEPTPAELRNARRRMAAFVRDLPILRTVIYGHGTLPEPVSRYGVAEHDRRMDRLEHDS